ncbi:MAG TPA: hypothetical protein VFM04_00860 [Candidatus Methylomirabilis sp.]|nr:hypothetical protein [Candidatus Methylomirabilis sp.]
MAEELDLHQVVPFEELLRACLYEQEALRRVLVRRGLAPQYVMNENPFQPSAMPPAIGVGVIAVAAW